MNPEPIDPIVQRVFSEAQQKFKNQHGLTNEELDFLKHVCIVTKGKILSVKIKTFHVKQEIPKIKGLIKGGTFKITKSRSFYRGSWKRETHN